MCCLARLDYLLPLLSLFAFAYFIYREVCGDVFSKEKEQLINRLGMDVFF